MVEAYAAPFLHRLESGHDHGYENRSPLGLLYGTLASYLLFSNTCCFSVAGACRVGAGSSLASWLGEPDGSVRGDVAPMVDEEPGWLGTFSEYSMDSIICFFRRDDSYLAARSALMLCFAK